MTSSLDTCRRLAAAVVSLLALLSTLHAPAGASRERAGISACEATGSISAARLPERVPTRVCDLVGRHVHAGSVRLEVPPPGHGVSSSSVGVGFENELTIVNESDGDVIIDDGEDGTGASVAAATEPCDKYSLVGCLDACVADDFETYTNNPRVRQKQPWFLKVSSRPSTLTAKQTVTHLKAGTRNVVQTRNSCGLSDVVGPTAPYRGATSKASGITVLGGYEYCPGSNGKNIVDFGPLGQFTLGLACSRWVTLDGGATWSIYEADIRLKKSAPWALNPDASGCSNRYDLQGVMTHERAHAFGLDHADDVAANSHLTMFPAAFPCTSYARTLGKGDRAGLAFLY